MQILLRRPDPGVGFCGLAPSRGCVTTFLHGSNTSGRLPVNTSTQKMPLVQARGGLWCVLITQRSRRANMSPLTLIRTAPSEQQLWRVNAKPQQDELKTVPPNSFRTFSDSGWKQTWCNAKSSSVAPCLSGPVKKASPQLAPDMPVPGAALCPCDVRARSKGVAPWPQCANTRMHTLVCGEVLLDAQRRGVRDIMEAA